MSPDTMTKIFAMIDEAVPPYTAEQVAQIKHDLEAMMSAPTRVEFEAQIHKTLDADPQASQAEKDAVTKILAAVTQKELEDDCWGQVTGARVPMRLNYSSPR